PHARRHRQLEPAPDWGQQRGAVRRRRRQRQSLAQCLLCGGLLRLAGGVAGKRPAAPARATAARHHAVSRLEANFDGLVGTTHHYAGLAIGNRASASNARQPSNPRQAARQGLDKMRAMTELGLAQAVLPPQQRPHLPTLRRLGFSGSGTQVIERAARDAPELLAACSSSAHMWAANAATVSASADTADGRVHFTPANLMSQLHRSIEAPATARILRCIFADEACFAHHAPLPATRALADEGAANHTRFVRADGTGVT